MKSRDFDDYDDFGDLGDAETSKCVNLFDGTYRWEYFYRFKRGDVCNYCGTIFGYDAETCVVGRRPLFGRNVSALLDAIEKTKRACQTTARSVPCPRCGRLPSEAYATEFDERSFFNGAIFLPFLAAAFSNAIVLALVALTPLDLSVRLFFQIVSGFGAATAAGCCLRFVARHWLFFRAPEKNLKERRKKNDEEERTTTRQDVTDDGFVAAQSAERPMRFDWILGLDRAGFDPNPDDYPDAKILGVRPDNACRGELEGRGAFWTLSAARIAATGANLVGYGGVFAFFSGVWPFSGSVLAAVLAACCASVFALSFVFLACVWFVNRRDIPFQGARHFGCGWEFDVDLGEEAEKEFNDRDLEKAWRKYRSLREIEFWESTRTVGILDAASELTADGRAMLEIAEREIEECAD